MRNLRTLAATALAFMIATPVAAGTPSTVYLALGDSLAWGDGASDPASTSYTALLSDYFAGEPHGGAKQYLNLAVRGETTSSYLAGQATAAIATIADPTTDTRTVTLSIGGNDLLDLLNEPTDPCVVDAASVTCQGLVATAMSTAAANYLTIMGSLSAALAAEDLVTEKVFVLTLYNPFGGTGSSLEGVVDVGLLGADLMIDCDQSNPMLIGLNDLVACISGDFGAIVIDGYAVVGDNAVGLTHIGDPGFNIHPNDAGYAAIAKAHRGADRGR